MRMPENSLNAIYVKRNSRKKPDYEFTKFRTWKIEFQSQTTRRQNIDMNAMYVGRSIQHRAFCYCTREFIQRMISCGFPSNAMNVTRDLHRNRN
ncbi:hypothetical protein PMAYCL1PPCAC_03751 [Pristionchus mayeri]|uniref:Uncharacterized protein n=1 Tax=Pristionchus mayeri TaxID=1317129 RepID=A0AAN5C893_9BILA|nr:hypothetical protein PMAYCL1PPCAC_03751 [Pristionchus mayeri]